MDMRSHVHYILSRAAAVKTKKKTEAIYRLGCHRKQAPGTNAGGRSMYLLDLFLGPYIEVGVS